MSTTKSRKRHTWVVVINDGFCVWRYTIRGREDRSIAGIAAAARNHLEGRITKCELVESWHEKTGIELATPSEP